MSAVFLWLLLTLLFLVLEAGTVALVSLWFAAGALAAMAAALLGAMVWLQVLLFLAVSIGLLAMLRPMLRRFVRVTRTNIDAVIGTQGYVTADIDNFGARGEVKLGAMTWSARSSSGEPIAAGVLVRADRIEGVRVFVTPVSSAEQN